MGNKQEIIEQSFYLEVKQILDMAREKVYRTANFAMVEAYWNIGKLIVEKQGGTEKAEYGAKLIKNLSVQMVKDFGKGFNVTNLKNMRQFYLTFPNGFALRSFFSDRMKSLYKGRVLPATSTAKTTHHNPYPLHILPN